MINRFKYIATTSYIAFIVLINGLFVYLPGVAAFGQSFSPADMMVGMVYLVRDFAQREIRHYVLVAMVIGTALSYVMASKTIALASIAGFASGEIIDWLIYTFTKRPLSQRLVWSASLSSPVDSYVFLSVAGRMHTVPFIMMILGKLVGVFVLWFFWKARDRRKKKVANPQTVS